MTVTTINVSDMHCAACSNKIENALQSFAEIQRLQFNPVRKQVFVTHDDALTSATLVEHIELAGFHPQLENDSRIVWDESRSMLKRLGIAGLAMMQVMMVQIALYAGAFQGIEEGVRRLLEYTALLFCIPVVVYSATPFFSSAFTSLRHGLNMDAPIALAILIAFSVSLVNTVTGSGEVYYDSVVMFTFLMLGARYIEQRLRHRLGIADSLQASMPRLANKITNTGTEQTSVQDIVPGDCLWIAEGDQIPLDGILTSETAVIEEALLTGESDWQQRSKGTQVFAGTLNRGAGFEVLVTADLQHSRVAQIDGLANTALDAKHNLSRLADRVARIFVPSILLIAAATFAAWWQIDAEQALSAALAVLVVSCPCALSLATPAALTAALTRLRHGGVLVKNSRALEVAGKLRHVFFDKTGTLTLPETRIDAVQTLAQFDADTCVAYAGALQAHSSHPLAQAFKSAAATTSMPPATGVEIAHGQGLGGNVAGHKVRIGSAAYCGCTAPSASTQKLVFMSIDEQPAAAFTLANDIRGDAQATIAELRANNFNVSMLSGDNETNCAALAARLGIDYIASSLPEAKPQVMRAQSDAGVMYVGDGMNDLPALASADVSVATLETTDLVKSKADVMLLTRRLGALVDFVRIARRSRVIMHENLSWALAYNLIAIPLAAFGYAPPWAAALGMSISSLIVMSNAARLLNTPLKGL